MSHSKTKLISTLVVATICLGLIYGSLPDPPQPVGSIDDLDDFGPHLFDRKLAKGEHTGLIVRVITRAKSGSSSLVYPILSQEEAYRNAFTGSLSASSQFRACSGDQFNLVPYKDGQVDGIVDVILDGPIGAYTDYSATDAIMQKLCLVFGYASSCDFYLLEPDIDHIMMVFPGGIQGQSALGWMNAAVNGKFSRYGDSTSYGVSTFVVETILHEVAHNLGVGHSVDHTGSNDNSNVMGSSFYLFPEGNRGDLRCYDGHVYHQLGWHQDRMVDMSPNAVNTVAIAGVGQLDRFEYDHMVYVKWGKYAIWYNSPLGNTKGTKEYEDRVIISEARAIRGTYMSTHVISALGSVGDEFRDGGFRVRLCEKVLGSPQYFKVAIGPGATCDAPALPQFFQAPEKVAPPTPSPTSQPTPAPTVKPVPPEDVESILEGWKTKREDSMTKNAFIFSELHSAFSLSDTGSRKLGSIRPKGY